MARSGVIYRIMQAKNNTQQYLLPRDYIPRHNPEEILSD